MKYTHIRQFIFLGILIISLGSCRNIGGELIKKMPTENSAFHFPYFLFLPESMSTSENIHLIVEPNNSGFVSDDLQKHEEKAERQATKKFYTGNYIARKLKYPLLIPVFPRSEKEWRIYTHALDRDAIMQKDNDLERIDLQMLAMVEDARNKLHELGFTVEEKILMTGFSASGTFVNRFAFIHPDKVQAYAVGGVNGLLILPLDTLEGESLNYPIGNHDFRSLFGKPFNSVAFKNLPQFLFMGELDDNDAIPYDDAFDEDERQLIYHVLGEKMHTLRWENCQRVYAEKNINAEFKTYRDLGHEQPEMVKEDILEFFQQHL